ncbi:MAG TPA: RNA 2',3'-cyclic phosphodiesterase [Paludibacteraceae bacterium]|nr:RNA 2',3'-cyclic phosphodiesterase [Paludibacteraceae bacterium]
MKLYIGIELPDEVKDTLFNVQVSLKQLDVKGKWKAPEFLHITLEFLGELPDDVLPLLSQVLKTVAGSNKAFKLQLEAMGSFPSWSRAHTLWVGVDGNLKQLNSLWSGLHSELKINGFNLQSSKFIPHITLLSRPQLPLPDPDKLSLVKSLRFKVTELILFESKAVDGRRVYPHIITEKLNG